MIICPYTKVWGLFLSIEYKKAGKTKYRLGILFIKNKPYAKRRGKRKSSYNL